jgi:flagellar biosynthetic protein FlhB
MHESRSEQATPRKLARARSRGVVARSPDLSAGAAVLAVAAALLWSGGSLLDALRKLVRAGLAAAAGASSSADPLAPLAEPARDVALALSVPLLAAFVAAWLAGVVQVGPMFAGAAVAPDLRRLNARERLGALLSSERWLELGWSALKLALLLGAAALILAPSLRGLLALPLGGGERAARALGAVMLDLALRMGAALLALGAIDLVFRRAQHARQLRMSRRELAEELRESHGLPEQHERRRRLYDELRAQAEIGGLERARVLLVDGAGRALALAFDAADPAQRAPRVVAKGKGAIALRMRLWAEHHALPVRAHAGLVAALFALELTELVPAAHYAAAAELFAGLSSVDP